MSTGLFPLAFGLGLASVENGDDTRDARPRAASAAAPTAAGSGLVWEGPGCLAEAVYTGPRWNDSLGSGGASAGFSPPGWGRHTGPLPGVLDTGPLPGVLDTGALPGVLASPDLPGFGWFAGEPLASVDAPSVESADADWVSSGFWSWVLLSDPTSACHVGASTRLSTPSSSAPITDTRLSPSQSGLIRSNQIIFHGISKDARDRPNVAWLGLPPDHMCIALVLSRTIHGSEGLLPGKIRTRSSTATAGRGHHRLTRWSRCRPVR